MTTGPGGNAVSKSLASPQPAAGASPVQQTPEIAERGPVSQWPSPQDQGFAFQAATRSPRSPLQLKESQVQMDLREDIAEAAQSVEDRIANAASEGRDALVSLANQLSPAELSQHLPTFPDAFWWVMDEMWPSGVGWRVMLEGDGSLTVAGTDAGVPFDIEVAAGSTVELSVYRQGQSIEVGVQPGAEATADAIPSVKAAELPCGITLDGVVGFKATVDLGAAAFPASGFTALKAGNVQEALWQFFSAGSKTAMNTQVEAEFGAGADQHIKGELGLNSVLKGVLEGGLAAGLACKMVTPTETRSGEVEMTGDVGAFVGFDVEIAGGENKDPLYIKALASSVLKNVNALVKTGVEGDMAVGLRVTVTGPPLSEPQLTIPGCEVAISLEQGAAVALFGQEAEGRGKVELVLGLPDLPGFVAEIQSGNIGFGQGALGPADILKTLPFSRIDSTLSFEATINSLVGDFSALERLWADFEDNNRLIAKLELELSADKSLIEGLFDRYGETVVEALTVLAGGDVRGGLRLMLDGPTEHLADLISTVQSLKAEVEIGDAASLAVGTPLEGDITGAGVGGGYEVMKVRKYEWTPEELGLDAFEAWLRGLV